MDIAFILAHCWQAVNHVTSFYKAVQWTLNLLLKLLVIFRTNRFHSHKTNLQHTHFFMKVLETINGYGISSCKSSNWPVLYQIYCAWSVKSSVMGYDVFTPAVSGTGIRTRTGTWMNGLYGFMENLSHYTWIRTGKNGFMYPIFRSWNCFKWCVLMISQWLSGVQSRSQTQPVWTVST